MHECVVYRVDLVVAKVLAELTERVARETVLSGQIPRHRSVEGPRKDK